MMNYITHKVFIKSANSAINLGISIDPDIVAAIPRPKILSKCKDSVLNNCSYLYKSFRLKEIRREIYFHFLKKREADALVCARVGKEIYVKFLGGV